VALAEDHLRERIVARFGPLASLVTALLLGDWSELDPALGDAFAVTGTLHLIAVSGLHVGFLAGMLAFALGLVRAGPGTRAAAATVIIAGYVALVGAPSSAVRAAVMSSLALWAFASERRVDLWQLWGAAAVAILAWRPEDLFDLGYVLSFGSVAGMLAFSGPLERALDRWSDDAVQARPPRIAALLGAGLVATTASTAATLPIQAAAFGWLAPVGFLLNPVAVPLVGVGLPLAWLALTADATGLGALAAPLAHAAGLVLGLAVALVASLGSGTTPWVPGPWGWAVGAILAVCAALLLSRRRPGSAIGLAALALALLLAAAPPRLATLEIAWLDVGQGDAIVIHFPDGAAWLVDAGPADPFGDAGRRAVLPYLRRRGVRRIERMVTTHPDLDHVGGAASVIRGMRVADWSSAGPIDDGPPWLDLIVAQGPAGAPRAERLLAGMRLEQGGAAIDVLHPPASWVTNDPYAARLPANEASVALLVRWRGCRALLTGDLGHPAEAALVRALDDSLRAELLHAGHHGSRHSSSAPFLNHVRPRHVVVSAGSGNRHGHPHHESLERFARIGATVWRTDRQGAIVARCGPHGWHLSSAAAYLR
jgi:competence protein ComEC